MSEYVINFAKVRPDEGSIKVFRITGKTNLGIIAKVINRYTEDLVASFLSSDYNKLRAGVYVTSMGNYTRKEEVETRIENALARYWEEQATRNFPIDKSLNVSNIAIEPFDIPSTAYVITNLLNNLLIKKVPRDLWCPRRPNEKFSICLDIEFLKREFWDKKVVNTDKRFMNFCNDYPNLCRSGEDGCSKFFRVVKCITMRFQHIISDPDNEEIYLVLHHYYRRLSNLNLKLIIDYMMSNQISLNNLLHVRVNYKNSRNSTLICEIVSINNNKLILKCEEENLENIHIDLNELNNVSIAVNPTYGSSRKFIGKYLCREFDKHKDLNKLYPSNYFSILENDLEIIKRIIGELCIGGTSFSVSNTLKRVW